MSMAIDTIRLRNAYRCSIFVGISGMQCTNLYMKAFISLLCRWTSWLTWRQKRTQLESLYPPSPKLLEEQGIHIWVLRVHLIWVDRPRLAHGCEVKDVCRTMKLFERLPQRFLRQLPVSWFPFVF